MLKLYRIKISTPFSTRWISQHAISERVARAMVSSKRVTVLEIVEA